MSDDDVKGQEMTAEGRPLSQDTAPSSAAWGEMMDEVAREFTRGNWWERIGHEAVGRWFGAGRRGQGVAHDNTHETQAQTGE